MVSLLALQPAMVPCWPAMALLFAIAAAMQNSGGGGPGGGMVMPPPPPGAPPGGGDDDPNRKGWHIGRDLPSLHLLCTYDKL